MGHSHDDRRVMQVPGAAIRDVATVCERDSRLAFADSGGAARHNFRNVPRQAFDALDIPMLVGEEGRLGQRGVTAEKLRSWLKDGR